MRIVIEMTNTKSDQYAANKSMGNNEYWIDNKEKGFFCKMN